MQEPCQPLPNAAEIGQLRDSTRVVGFQATRK
jgi:hypothetical protein